MRNYVPVNGPNSGLQSMSQYVTPQKPHQSSQFSSLTAPPPPAKQSQWQQYGGYHVYGPPIKQCASSDQGQTMVQPLVQSKNLFPCPPPSVPVVDHLTSGNGVVPPVGDLGKSDAAPGSDVSTGGGDGDGSGGSSGSVADK